MTFKKTKDVIRPGQIRYIDLGRGDEYIQGGVRPCIIRQNHVGCSVSSIIRIIPLTGKIKATHLPVHILIPKTNKNGLFKDSMALVEQERAVSRHKIGDCIGEVEDEILWMCNEASNNNVYVPEINSTANACVTA